MNEEINKIDSEDKSVTNSINSIDHHTLSKKELVKRFKFLIENFGLGDLKGEVELIRSAFYIKHNKELEERKQKFLNDGGIESEFSAPVSQEETEMKELLNRYKEKKSEYFHSLETLREKSIQEKNRIIEEIKNLVNKDESLSRTFEIFKELQQSWKETNSIHHPKSNELWETYQHHVENFYDYIKINKELRDLDFKRNLEQKIIICEQAEELTTSHDPQSAFDELQGLHLQWREIGPVSREIRENIWERFKTASSTINRNNQKFYEAQREEFKTILQERNNICEQIEQIANNKVSTIKEWNNLSQSVLEIQERWKSLKSISRSAGEKTFKRYRASCDLFFNNKREFYATYKNIQEDNLRKKRELCERAENIQESDNWQVTSQILVDLQKEWKTIGPVHKRYSEAVWGRFRKACNHFFERKSAHFASGDDAQNENLKLKQDLLEEIKSYEAVEDMESNQLMITSYNERWKKIGYVPFSMKEKIQNEFRAAIDGIFSKLDLTDEEKKRQIQLSRFEEIINHPEAQKKLDAERVKISTKLKDLESDIQVWENNIGFFSSVSNKSDHTLEKFQKRIEDGKDRIKKLRADLRLIDQQYKRI